jgi:DNA-binding CsgD family transcriptional regulator
VKKKKRTKEVSPAGHSVDPTDRSDFKPSKDFPSPPESSQGSNSRKNKQQDDTKNCNTCYNSYYSSSKSSVSKKVLRLVEESQEPLSPKEVKEKLHIKSSTARGTLRRLFIQGKIVQDHDGKYCSKITHSMMRRHQGVLPSWKVHNLIVVGGAVWLSNKLDDFVENIGDVKIHVQFGLQRRKITGRFSCDKSMEKDTALFALNRWLDIVKQKTGHDLRSFEVKTCEISRDFEKMRLDGDFKCLTRKSLFGIIERIYQKGDDVVRHEFKTSKSMSLMEFESLLRGGASNYNLIQGLFMVVQEVKKLVEAVKFSNEWTVKDASLSKAVLEALINMKEQLATDNSRLTQGTLARDSNSACRGSKGGVVERRQDRTVTSPQSRQHQSLFMRFCIWLNKDISLGLKRRLPSQ